MFKHILVPLDGSKLAEAALPVALSFATAMDAPVTLLHVIEQHAPEEIHHQVHLTGKQEAETYLAHVAKTFFPQGLQVDWHVHTAAVQDVSRSIVDHSADEFQPDLIILSSHGNSGVHDLLYGTIAQEVAAEGETPVLLVKPSETLSTFAPRHILVPLDNESIHDAVLPLAKDLARGFSAQLDLLCVIPTFSTLSGEKAAASNLMPATTAAYLDITEENAREHFQEHLDDFIKSRIPASAVIARGDPAVVITRTAEELPADLIIFGTHGRAGLEAFWNRSVAAGVARRTSRPLLLVPLEPPTSS
jgi:nucleotide-binding universal stress UspA family protein